MKTVAGIAIAVLVLASTAGAPRAVESDKEGVTPGKWTMDFDAAKKHAKEKKTPILINFTGSDWCGWCKLMERNVFDKQDWKDYAKTGAVMVMIDFPRDKSLVPAKFAKRNDELKGKYKVRGYPTYVLLDDDGETVLGRLRAGRTKTPKSFIAELKVLTRYRGPEVAKYTETLKDDEKTEYKKIIDEVSECRKLLKEQRRQIADAEKKIAELEGKVEKLKEAATEFRAKKLGPDKLKEYKETKTKLAEARKALSDWLATGPTRSQENSRKYAAMNAEVKKLEEKLTEF
jgi:thioredoxin-related protein